MTGSALILFWIVPQGENGLAGYGVTGFSLSDGLHILESWNDMNPFGIFQAVVAAFEAVADAVNPKRRKETKGEKRRFLFWYFLFLFICAAVVAWTIHSLYF